MSSIKAHPVQPQLLQPAINALIALDQHLTKISSSLNALSSSFLLALRRLFTNIQHRVIPLIPTKGDIFASTLLAVIVIFAITILVLVLLGTLHLVFRIFAHIQRHFSEASFPTNSIGSSLSSSPSPEPQYSESKVTYNVYTDTSILQTLRSRPDMQLAQKWGIRPRWSVWPARVLWLLHRGDYDALEEEVRKQLREGGLVRIKTATKGCERFLFVR